MVHKNGSVIVGIGIGLVGLVFSFFSVSPFLLASAAVIPNNSETYGNAFNEDNPFVYPVPFTIWFLLQSPLFNLTHGVFNEPHANETREEIDGYYYHRAQECGVHFLNQHEGLIITHEVAENETDIQRCTWGFVGNQFCTPSVHCPTFKVRESNCRETYLQVTDAGESFMSHYCDNVTTPLKQEITAEGGLLDVTYRFADSPGNIEFECLVKCVPYKANFTGEIMAKIPNAMKMSAEPTMKKMELRKPKAISEKPKSRKEFNFPAVQTTDKCKCGIPNGYKYRIVGGREPKVSQYPWVAGILNVGKKLPFCGGSLINDQYILTAAHCMEDENLEDIVVILNEHDFDNHTETYGKTIKRGIVEIIPFHYYLDSTFYGDVALLRLDKPVDISKFTLTPICLPQDETKMYESYDVIGAGWGTLMEEGKKSPKLQEVIMKVYSNAACNDYHSSQSQFPPQVTDNMLCAGFNEGGRDTCAGDSGGPLFTWENKRFTQIGVTSWGFGCGNRLNPGVFARTTAFNYWIKANTLNAVWCS